MPERARRWVPTAVAALALATVLAGCSASGADEPTRGANQQGYVGVDGNLTQIAPDQRRPVPTVSGPALSPAASASGAAGSPKTVSTADYRGTVVVLNIWGSWCAPCREEAPALQAASDATRGKAQFIGLNVKDAGPAAPAAFLRAQGITYPSIFDPSGQTLLSLAGQIPPSAIPSTVIVDQQGRGAVRVLGAVSKASLVQMIDDVAAGR